MTFCIEATSERAGTYSVAAKGTGSGRAGGEEKEAMTARTAEGDANEETVKAPPIGPYRYLDVCRLVVERVKRVVVVVDHCRSFPTPSIGSPSTLVRLVKCLAGGVEDPACCD